MSVRMLGACVVASSVLLACSPTPSANDVEEATSTSSSKMEETVVADPAPAKPAAPAFVPLPLEQGVAFTTKGGMQILAHSFGNGSLAVNGHPVTVHYTGWLYDEQAADNKGKKFDSSVDRDTPFRFMLGAKKVIRGWDEGVLGMKVGGKRTLTIPPDMAYGARGYPGAIPPAATLVFDVELLGVE